LIKGQKETFGILKQNIDPKEKYIWIHAASLGEFEQGRPIIERIKSDYKEYRILLTFFSSSGYEVRKNYELADIVCYLPFDKKKNVRRFIELANPSVAIFIKYEFWYNYIHCLFNKGIPVFMVSAIFRPGQLFFRWYGKAFRRILDYYKCICVQDEKSKALLSAIGVNNAVVCGDTRFDRVLEIRDNSKTLPVIESFVQKKEGENPIILIAGSSWPKDEDIFIQYFNTNNVKLIIAPHEIQESHLKYIENMIKCPSIRYSQATQDNVGSYNCIIIDAFRLLSSIYKYGDIAYIGGGFLRDGIHNVLEAAVYNVPVIFGPVFKKFLEAVELIEIGGGYSIRDYEGFRGIMDEFVQHPEMLSSAGKQAGDYVRSHAGVVDKVMAVLNL